MGKLRQRHSASYQGGVMEGKTVLLSIWVTWFALLGLVFIHQLTFIRDVTRHMLSNLHRNLNLEVYTTEITCDRSNIDFDICTMNGATLLDQTSFTFFTLDSNTRTKSHTHVKIHPYPLKNSKDAMSSISEFTLTSDSPKYSSQCSVTHDSPALVFSGSGYTGNFYHDMNEIFIPLFITINSLSPDRDVTLVIIDSKAWWLKKYADLLSAISPHRIIVEKNNLTTMHCFPSAIIGLIKHGQLIIDPKLLPYPKTLFDFHAFLKSVYIKKDTTLMYPDNIGDKPLLTLVSRKGNSRVILNQEEVIKLAEDIGFKVHALETTRDSSIIDTYRLIHSSHVMLGVHGAGLTNLLFLRQGSVLVQVVPIGLEWASETYYNKPTKILGLEYVEYKVEANESSLSWKYGANSLVIKDPETFRDGKWTNQLVYLKKQNVIIDLIRFRKCLTEVYRKAKLFMNTSTT